MPEKSLFDLPDAIVGAIAGMLAMIQGLGAMIIKRWRKDHDKLVERVDTHDDKFSNVATIDDFRSLEKTIVGFHTTFNEQAEERTERVRKEIKEVYKRIETGEAETRKEIREVRDMAIENKAQHGQ